MKAFVARLNKRVTKIMFILKDPVVSTMAIIWRILWL